MHLKDSGECGQPDNLKIKDKRKQVKRRILLSNGAVLKPVTFTHQSSEMAMQLWAWSREMITHICQRNMISLAKEIWFDFFLTAVPPCSSLCTHVRNNALINVWSDSKLLNLSLFLAITSLQRSSWNRKVLTLATFQKSSISFWGCGYTDSVNLLKAPCLDPHRASAQHLCNGGT